MDWDEYRERCDEGDVLSRWLLVQTAALLRADGAPEMADRLEACLQTRPLEKPADHLGGPDTDFFQVTLPLDEVRRIAEMVERAARDPDRRLDDGRDLGGLPEAWGEFRGWLDGTHPRSPVREN